MKKVVLFLLLIGPALANAQSLKDLLYSGKLKMDSNSVVRKTDDLKSKIDTAQKKKPEPDKAVVTTMVDSAKNTTSAPINTTAAATTDLKDSAATTGDMATTEEAAKETTAAAPVKTNTKIWKEYTDSLVNTLKAEVLSNKKIKKETYYLTVAYEIDTAGQVTISNVTATPENALLQSQVKQRMEVTPPPLNPVLDAAGKPRKIKRNHNFSVTKE